MTTDTALALLRDAAGNLYMAYNAFTRNDAIAWEPLKETADRITALLDSGIKDAGDDVVEPVRYGPDMSGEMSEWATGEYVSYSDYYTLLSAYKRAQQECKSLDYRGDQHLKAYLYEAKRAEKAESERDEFRKNAERKQKGLDAVSELIKNSHGVSGLHLNGDIAPWDELLTGGRFEEWLLDFDAAIDSARNK